MRTFGEQRTEAPAWPWERLPGGRWLGRLGLALLMLFWAWVLMDWPLTRAATLLVGAAVGVVMLVRPVLGLPLLALAIPFGSLRSIDVGPASVGLQEALLGAIVVAWLGQQLARRSLQMAWPSLAWAGLALLAVMLASFLPATSWPLAAKEMAKWVELWVAIVFVASVAGGRDVEWLVLGLLLAGAAQGLLGLYQFFTLSGPPEFLLMGRFMRAAGTFRQPNPYGGYLGLTLPLAVGILLASWPAIGQEVGGRRLLAIWLAAAAASALMLGGLFASWSRGAWLGAAAALVAVVLARGGRWWRGALAGVLLVVLLSLVVWGRLPVPEALSGRFADISADLTMLDVRGVEVTDANFAVVERTAHWQAAWGMFSDHPWTGVGIGNYPAAYERYALPRWADPLGHAHNYYLNILAEAGLPGLGAYLLWAAAGLWLAVRAVRASRGLQLGISLGALGMWVHLSVHNLFDNLYVHGMGIQVGLMLGLAAWVIAASGAPRACGERADGGRRAT